MLILICLCVLPQTRMILVMILICQCVPPQTRMILMMILIYLCYSPDRPFSEDDNDDADGALQVASSIIEGATQGQIVNGDYSGTPNRFLMTYMDTSPSVSITPEVLPPVVLFAGMKHCDMCCVCIYNTIYIVFCVYDMLCINRVTMTHPCIHHHTIDNTAVDMECMVYGLFLFQCSVLFHDAIHA